MQIQLTWDDPITEEQQQHQFETPIALGRELAQLPTTNHGQPVSQVVLLDANQKISRFHAWIADQNNQLIIEDRSANGSILNGQKIKGQQHPLQNGDVLQVGSYNITITIPQSLSQATIVDASLSTIAQPRLSTIVAPLTEITSAAEVSAPPPSTIVFHPETDAIETQENLLSPLHRSFFPPPALFAADRVSVSALHASGYPVDEIDYAAIGGGMGSFVWVDTLRIAGVKPEQIAVLSIQEKPYKRYETLLRNCQIPRYKRIRSGSDSCPDNIWGWPGYALRDACRSVSTGQLGAALGFLWQVFSEPVLADTYTPRARDVFDAMDREATRISWDRMWRYGSVRSIRKTEDGRYVIAYSATRPPGAPNYRFLIARYVHLCTGYPALKLLPDLQNYRETTQDLKSVVQGYEPHDHIFEHLEKYGGTVLVRGFGIVGSQILDRVYEARKQNPNITLVHLSRSPKRGNQFGVAKRYVENQWEFQPFNWPKATWGGDMRSRLEASDPLQRRELLESWGGTTTASRGRWRQIVKQGIREGWYILKFGQVEKVERSANGKPITFVRNREYAGFDKIEADFVIDCTGLVSNPRDNPLLNDLITHYNLDLNPQGRLHVENSFEIKKMRNDRARMYAAGIITLGGPYAPVDTFLGLQYAAHRATESLAQFRAPNVHYIEGMRSLWQWFKWAANQAP
ncbi:FHA domain-containing protein [Leptolyngbya sp. GGD]|uniref:FHA domain-containing protein n=1 Tax=Leptolyngbya sp. GGD TaxID=2997907 RepID=UPI00227BB090|nr:FHA domain-containing protein [Leptolyngbya sp. GGD]MCY6494431.1 FHA domain-containing protein [Leptolyngbya sp. GGD]